MTESTSIPLAVGTWLENRYRIRALLGQGGMSRVYLADDARLGIRVAIKENLQTSANARAQFDREAQMLARLSHPHIPRVTDRFTEARTGRQYLVMEYIEGEDLAAMVQRVGPLPEATALNWIRQILDAVEYLHGQSPPVIHRDIKPANIKITPQGKAVLVDFGIAKLYDPQRGTATGLPAVTPGYAPPEQYGLRTTQRSDIYALGATLYTLLTGQTPPEAPLRQAGEEGLVPPGRLAPLSPRTEQAIVRAMELENTRRWQSASELRAALEGRLPSVTPLQPTVFVATSPKRRNILAPLIVAAIGIAIVVIAVIVSQSVHSVTLTVALSSPTPVAASDSPTPEPTAPPGLAEVAGIPPVGVTPSATGPAEKVSVPLVVGASLDSALAILQRANLEVEKVEEANASCGVGVMRQEPGMGTMVNAGSRIRIVVCIGPTPASLTFTTVAPVSTSMPIPPANPTAIALLLKDDFEKSYDDWPGSSNSDREYYFGNGEYHIVVKKENWLAWASQSGSQASGFDNFWCQVEARQIEGKSGNYGLVFRERIDADSKNDAYFFRIDPGNGSYSLRKLDQGEWTSIVDWTASSFIRRGSATNILKVVANGSDISLYANGGLLGFFTDSTFTTGKLGMVAGAFSGETNFHAAFDNFEVWSVQ